jgi:hypothetical protein
MHANDLAAIVDELIDILKAEAEELERFVTHVEQVTTRLPDGSEIAVIRSSLAGLHQRLHKLRGVSTKASTTNAT